LIFCVAAKLPQKKNNKAQALVSRHLAKLGRKGGKARLQTMTEGTRGICAKSGADTLG
jgi:hypothetical protein